MAKNSASAAGRAAHLELARRYGIEAAAAIGPVL
jgi:hypothetical protein